MAAEHEGETRIAPANTAASQPAQSVDATCVAKGLTPQELWEVMWRRNLIEHWLGSGSAVPLRVGSRLLLADSAGPWRRGALLNLKWASTLEAVLDPVASWQPGSGANTVIMTVAAREEGGATLRITESGPYVPDHAEEINRYWGAVTDRLSRLLGNVSARRDAPRQAVVVIHGIGEQEPGRTLRALVSSGVIAESDAESFVKPDKLSESFELRTVTFKATEGRVRPTTDVYELYWAHLIRDTTVGQVGDFVRQIMLRKGVPKPLRPLWASAWLALLTVLAVVLGELVGWWQLPAWLKASGAVVLGVSIAWRLVGKGIVIDVLGDAARYLSPRPANIAHRQAIRQSGVDLVTRLHEDGRYDRIVVLGHSLGSVIAYDVLTYAWLDLHTRHSRPGKTDFKPLIAMERVISQPTETEDDEGQPVDYQQLQHNAWFQTRCNTQPWLVTDLITVGSPLTYAGFLMASSRKEFETAQHDRILPTCPPQTSTVNKFQRCTYDRSYRPADGRGKVRSFTVCDHGAVFGLVRWTNLYFRVGYGGLRGDLVGGPVHQEFGVWVKDVPMAAPPGFAHTAYWRSSPAAAGDNAHLAQLKAALRMDAGGELLKLATLTPAFVIAERVVARMRP